jgi:ABC-type polysaccharide/polyol phosphate export permease
MVSAQAARRAVWRPLWELPRRFDLVWPLARRFTAARYRGSALGLAWAVVTPVVMIAIFTFIFAGIFNARFGPRGTTWDYALYLFCGLLPWTAFQESVQQSAGVVVAHANLVKRVVFPLEALPLAQTLASVAGQLFGTAALVAAALAFGHELHATIFYLPLLLAPQLLLMLGASWLVASLGVFIRDTAQAAGSC